MAEFRYNPLLDDYVIINSDRQKRPDLKNDECAFCPGSGKVPNDGYSVMRYKNDFPCMSENPPKPDNVSTEFYKTQEAYGRCEVILYSPEHDKTVSELSDENMYELAKTWKEIYNDFKNDEKIKYVMIFENRGKEVGVTMHHPHGQVYGYGYMPLKLKQKLLNATKYKNINKSCLFCDILKEEKKISDRIIFENEFFTVFVPFFTEYPYGVYIFTNQHTKSLSDMNDLELNVLGKTVKTVAGMYDELFGYTFPYMMCMHNSPVNQNEDIDWHFHIEFYPPMRSENSIKFNASSETGAWAHCNPTCPEEKANELKIAYRRYIEKNNEY